MVGERGVSGHRIDRMIGLEDPETCERFGRLPLHPQTRRMRVRGER
jgi:hypothetical protein